MSELLEAVYRGDQAASRRSWRQRPSSTSSRPPQSAGSERVRELLDSDPGLVSAWTEDGFTPLHLAAFFRRPDTARLLVERGALVDVVARNEELQVTPLQSAAAAREEETAALLLERGADPNTQQRGGFTALHAAAQHGDEPLVELLLAHGADPSSLRPTTAVTAADFARDGGHPELAARLSAG